MGLQIRQRDRLNNCCYIGWIDTYCTVFVNSTNLTTNIETAVLSKFFSHAEQGIIHILYIYVSHL